MPLGVVVTRPPAPPPPGAYCETPGCAAGPEVTPPAPEPPTKWVVLSADPPVTPPAPPRSPAVEPKELTCVPPLPPPELVALIWPPWPPPPPAATTIPDSEVGVKVTRPPSAPLLPGVLLVVAPVPPEAAVQIVIATVDGRSENLYCFCPQLPGPPPPPPEAAVPEATRAPPPPPPPHPHPVTLTNVPLPGLVHVPLTEKS